MAKKADGSLGDFSVAVTFPKVNAQFQQRSGCKNSHYLVVRST